MPRTWKNDADEWGAHVRQGGWRLGLLVARSVKAGAGNGRPPKTGVNTPVSQKVSATEFGTRAGTSKDRVLRYLEAWDAAADDGVKLGRKRLPHSSKLTPDTELDLDVESLPDWSEYYPPGDSNYRKATPEARELWNEAAAETGATAQSIARAAASPPAIEGAILADPKIRQVAARALDKSYEDRARQVRADRPIQSEAHDRQSPDQDRADATELMVALRKVHRDMVELSGKVSDIPAEAKNAVRTEMDWLIQAAEAIRAGCESPETMDEQLAVLLDQESGR